MSTNNKRNASEQKPSDHLKEVGFELIPECLKDLAILDELKSKVLEQEFIINDIEQ